MEIDDDVDKLNQTNCNHHFQKKKQVLPVQPSILT